MAVGQPVQGIPAQGMQSLQQSGDGGMPAHASMRGYVTHDASMGVASSSGLSLLPLSPSVRCFTCHVAFSWPSLQVS